MYGKCSSTYFTEMLLYLKFGVFTTLGSLNFKHEYTARAQFRILSYGGQNKPRWGLRGIFRQEIFENLGANVLNFG